MSSILERPNLNKIFLIYGNLDDMFISPDLQKNNFRPYLNSYLKSLGYQKIVFYSGAKNTGKYVLDDESAVLAINRNKRQGTVSENPDKPKRRILSPKAKQEEQKNEVKEDAQKSAENAKPQDNGKMVYKQPKITPAEFLDDAKKMMKDSGVKTAVVFTFFQDFVTDNSAPQQQYSELLSHLWDEYTLNGNENICIFLAPQMNADSISGMFDKLQSGDVFRNRFFNENKTINRSCTIYVGLPNQDEFRYMLEYLRIVGDNGKKLSYRIKDVPKMVSSLMYLSREANREENRAGYLSSVYENIAYYMRNFDGDTVPFDESVIKKIYSRFKADSGDPMEILMNTKGWESVAKRIQEIVKDYKQKKARALAQRPKSKGRKKLICASERINTPEDNIEFNYPVPHFILRGNPGVGKTTVARLIGQIFYENGILKKGLTVEATRDDLIDRYVGGTTGKTREAVMSAQEGVLFIDDAYSLLDGSEENNYPKQAIDELVAIMTNPKQYRFCMIMAGYPEPMDELLKMNAGLSSRFSKANILTIEDYKPDLLKSIFVSNCEKEGYKIDETLDLDLFFKNLYDQRDRANFGNARDVVAIARETKMQSSLRDDDERLILKEDFGSYEKYFDKHGVSSIDEIYAEIDNYIGMEFVKELFENVRLEILDEEDCKRRGVKPDFYADHYIFSGNPGTGKTTVGKMIGRFYHVMGVLGGKGNATKLLTEEHIKAMKDHNVPQWYIDSCMKIKYMFPKAHAAAYMIATLRLGWYKVHKPVEYYAAYFTVKNEDFDAALVIKGRNAVRAKMEELSNKISKKEATAKEETTYAALQIINEMLARGIGVLPIDIYKSDSKRFLVENGKIRLPFVALSGVGEAAANGLAEARNDGEFTSIEDFQQRAKVSKSVIDMLRDIGTFGNLPESSQLRLM